MNHNLRFERNFDVLSPYREIELMPFFDPFEDMRLSRTSKYNYFLGIHTLTQELMQETKYQIVDQKFDRHVVIPDLHGENALLEKVIDQYQREDTGFVFLGDLIDRRGNSDDINSVPKLLDTISALGSKAIITLANHELILLGALNSKDSIRAYAYSYYYDMIKANTLSDYGLVEDKFEYAKEDLLNIMNSLGHLSLLESVTPYYETEDFIATHAGISHTSPWEVEKEKLDKLSENLSKGEFPDPYPKHGVQMEDGLDSIFSFKNATDTRPITSTDKIIVSGHAHNLYGSKLMGMEVGRNPIKYRSILDGQRIRLASQLNRPQNDDLYIWQDWDGQVKVIKNFR